MHAATANPYVYDDTMERCMRLQPITYFCDDSLEMKKMHATASGHI